MTRYGRVRTEHVGFDYVVPLAVGLPVAVFFIELFLELGDVLVDRGAGNFPLVRDETDPALLVSRGIELEDSDQKLFFNV